LKRIFVLAAVLSLAGVACSSTDDGGAITSPSPTGGAPAGAVETDEVVGTTSSRWEPKDIIVASGSTVGWEWEGGAGGHNVVFDNGMYRSGDPTADGTAEFTFDAAGTFQYYCEIHGNTGGVGMAGTVTVQ
jgi:plastocyanin